MIAITPEDFDEAVDDALDSLPEAIARAIAEANVVILVEEDAPPDQMLLGLYEGIPLDRRSVFDGGVEPDRIRIFRGPLQQIAHSRDDLVEQIRVTVLHELGHLFGMSEERLHQLGWG